MKECILSLWQWRALLWYLVKVDFKVTYQNKILGYIWSLLDPLMLMAVYVVLVQYIFRMGEPLYPVLLFSTLLPWHWFLHAVQRATTCITRRGKLIQTVAFPKVLLPTQEVLSTFSQYLLGFGALLLLLWAFKVQITIYIFWLPLAILAQFMLTWGIALLCSVGGVYFRDLSNILEFSLRMLWYLSPGLYSVADRIPISYRPIYMLNPFAALFETYKNILVRGQPPPMQYLWLALGLGVVFLLLGFWLFARQERNLAKEV
jgi:ABC-type polysaccharide/polyol phosphate export permease